MSFLKIFLIRSLNNYIYKIPKTILHICIILENNMYIPYIDMYMSYLPFIEIKLQKLLQFFILFLFYIIFSGKEHTGIFVVGSEVRTPNTVLMFSGLLSIY